MGNDPGFPQRRSIRLRTFDYRTPGCSIVTICTQHRVRLFGEIVDGEMVPSPAGSMVRQIWDEIPSFYPNVDIDAFVVMPNHVHGIVVLPSIANDLSPKSTIPTGNSVGVLPVGAPTDSAPRLSLFDVVERFKSLTTKRYGDGVRKDGWPRYQGRLWQRDYYERVVRNEAELAKFRGYIEHDPARWFEDPYRGD